jgi:hypothetical protein
MEATLSVLNDLESRGLLTRYAIGGAMALLFHTEPVATFDLDIFCLIPEAGPIGTLSPLYETLRQDGHTVEAEHVLIASIPVQFSGLQSIDRGSLERIGRTKVRKHTHAS